MAKKKGENEDTPPKETGPLDHGENPFLSERTIILVAILILALDQLTKVMVVNRLPADPGRRDSPNAREFFIFQEIKKDLREATTKESREKIMEELKAYEGRFEIVVIEGFFSIIHRTNDGAAFSIFQGQNSKLAFISVIALGALIWFRRHFDYEKPMGRMSFGLLIGGILGNMVDRIFRGSVVDFVEVSLNRSDTGQLVWPAFNVADAAIVIGVALLFVIAWRADNEADPEAAD